MEVVTDNNIVIENIKRIKPKIIGIDGTDGIGKTTLAKELEKLSYKRISLDDYLKNKSGEYFKFLDLEKLKRDLTNQNNLVIEGVLLNMVLNSIGINADYLIYITDSVWLDDWTEEYGGKYLSMNLEEIIKSVEQTVNRINRITNPSGKDYKMDGLRKEIYEYSFEQRPWLLADIIIKSG
jgi:adenylate kinase family enzyme